MTDRIETRDAAKNPARGLVRMAHEGVELCRSGRWEDGVEKLQYAVNPALDYLDFPALAFSYLGYGLATLEKQYKLGLELCKRGIAIDSFEVEAYLCLAKTYMLLGSKRPAIEALDQGLRVDPNYKRLLEMRSDFGRRRPSLLPSLPRNHFVNRANGELRSRLTKKRP